MGFLDALLGGKGKRVKGAAPDRLFAMTTAQITLDTGLGLKHKGAVAIVFQLAIRTGFMRGEPRSVPRVEGFESHVVADEQRGFEDRAGHVPIEPHRHDAGTRGRDRTGAQTVRRRVAAV